MPAGLRQVFLRFSAAAAAYDEYLKLLTDQEAAMAGLAAAHGFCCPPDKVQRGYELRAAINRLKATII
jgi:hypothetical protein